MIVLVNPPFRSRSTYKFTYQRGEYAHLGLACLAGYMEKRNVDFDVIDAKFHHFNEEQVISRLKKMEPQLVGLTATTTEVSDAQNFAHLVKKNLPNCFLILGGVHATALPLETLELNADLDAIAVGEGEFTLEALSLSSDFRETISKIPGVYFRDGDMIRNTPAQEYNRDPEDYAPAPLHLWPEAKRYYVHTYRGCPFSCSFCFRALGRRTRLRDPRHVLTELEYVAEHSRQSEVSICDSTFGLHRKHTKAILSEIIKRGLNRKLEWGCGTRVDIVDRELLEIMREAGCVSIAFGVESGSDRILKATGKNTSVRQAAKAVRLAKSLGFKTVGYYIFGHIGETKVDVKKTTQLIYRLNTDKIAIGMMTPWPGTKVFELAQKNEGGYRLKSREYSEYDKYFGSAMEFENFSQAYLDFMRIKAFLGLYFCNRRYFELLDFLYHYRRQAFSKIGHITKLVLGRARTGTSRDF